MVLFVDRLDRVDEQLNQEQQAVDIIKTQENKVQIVHGDSFDLQLDDELQNTQSIHMYFTHRYVPSAYNL